MTRCEEVKKFKYEFRNVKQEPREQLNLLPFLVKIINFVENSNSTNVEPYSKVKMFYNLDQVNYDFVQVIPLVDILLDQLEQKFCRKSKPPRFKRKSRGKPLE